MLSGCVLNPTSDGFSAQLDLHNRTAFEVLTPAEFPPPSPKPAYASSYDTEGSVATDPAHYENRTITLRVRVIGSSASTLEANLNLLYNMVGQVNREGGVLKITTPNSTVCYFDLVPEASATTTVDKLYQVASWTIVEVSLVARPFWRGAEVQIGSESETTLPALEMTVPQIIAGFVPSDVSGLEVWCRPETLGAAASSVSAWSNEGSGADLEQATGADQPTVQASVLDGQKVVRFDGSSDYLGAAISADASRTIFLVVKQNSFTNDDRAMSLGSFSLLRTQTGPVWSWTSNQAGSDVTLTGSNPDAWQLITLRVNSTSSMDAFINGGSAQNFDPEDSVTSATSLFIGAGAFGSTPAHVDVAEVIVYDSALGTTARDQIRGYLSDKYPTLGTFGTDPGASSGVPVAGDVPALGRLVVTEADGDDQWTVFYGLQSRYYSADAEAALYFAAEDLTPVGSSTDTGGASGALGNVIRNTDLIPTWQAILRSEIDTSNAALEHKGDFRVFARLYRPTGNTGAVSVRLEWAVGDYRNATLNDAVAFAADGYEGLFTLVDLGTVNIDPESTRWEFRILAKSTVAGDELDVDYVLIVPTTEGYGEPSALLQVENPSSLSARDEFDQSAGALTGKTAAVGGTWAGAGDADDYSVETTGKTAQRTATLDADSSTGRYAVSGVSAFAAQVAQVDFKTTVNDGTLRQGVLARYTDTSNWLRAAIIKNSTPYFTLTVDKRVSGTVTQLGAVFVPLVAVGKYSTLRLLVDGGGMWAVWSDGTLVLTGRDSALATGGALATGKPGFYDTYGGASAATRNYDNFLAFPPVSDAAVFASQSLEITHDKMHREDSTGTFYGRVSVPRGRYLTIPPAGPENRSTRLLVKGVRGPEVQPRVWLDGGIDDISAALYATPRGLVVPEF